MKFDTMFQDAFKTINHEGAEAYSMAPEMELYTAVVTASLSPMTYEGANERIERIDQLVRKCSPMFVAQLAVYARTQMYLRSVPLLLIAELAKVHSGDSLVARAIEKTVLRADEIMELLACYQWRNPVQIADKPQKRIARLSKQVQKGLQQAFNTFDEYQFAKYDSDSRAIRLRDALFLTHPVAKSPEQQAIFDKIASGTLQTPYTWETELSALGQQQFASQEEKDRAFADKWSELILSGRLGYMALMRNLRNILQLPAVSTEAIEAMLSQIADPKAVARAKQLPFRYLSAYKEIQGVSSMATSAALQALEEAAKASAANIASFGMETRVVIASDVSGSMFLPISPKSKVQQCDIGLMLSMLLQSRCKRVIAGIFGSIWKEISFPKDSILANVQELHRRAGEVGCSTNGFTVIDNLIQRRIVADKVMMFTDMQMWDSSSSGQSLKRSWCEYRRSVAPKAKLYLFDLDGYGQSPISLAEKDVYLIAGWSDKIFDVLAALEQGQSALSEIRKITL